jgi:transposase
LPELAGALASATGVVAHAASIGRFLRKLGYTYKKSHWSRPSGCAHG